MKCLIGKFKLFLRKVPININQDEKIVKVVFSPLNFTAKQQLKGNAFKCKRDDLSVNRLDYTDLHLCKCLGLSLEKQALKKGMKNKGFVGVALLFTSEIREQASIVFKPVWGNKAHAEIVTGIVDEQAGEAQKAEYNLIAETLARKSRVFKDSDTKKRRWVDSNSKTILRLKYEL